MSTRLQIALLAAGGATRFGGAKLDIPIAGKPLGYWALECALTLQPARTVIIVPDRCPAFAQDAAEAGRADLVVNMNARAGISTSIALAAGDAAVSGVDALLLMLADMPAVMPDTLRQLVANVAPGRPAAARYADGGGGIPACFPRDYFAALQSLEGDRGAAALLRTAAGIRLVETPAEQLSDVDTPADISRASVLLAGPGSRS